MKIIIEETTYRVYSKKGYIGYIKYNYNEKMWEYRQPSSIDEAWYEASSKKDAVEKSMKAVQKYVNGILKGK